MATVDDIKRLQTTIADMVAKKGALVGRLGELRKQREQLLSELATLGFSGTPEEIAQQLKDLSVEIETEYSGLYQETAACQKALQDCTNC